MISPRPTVLDLFSGCGGMSLGFEYAGFAPSVAIEVSEMAAETHFRNFQGRGLVWDGSDWQRHLDAGRTGRLAEQVKFGVVVASVLDVLKDEEAMSELHSRNFDVIIGGPPCQGYSMAGRRDSRDSRNKLPWAFLQYVTRLMPKVVVIENVIGIDRTFRSSGLSVSAFQQLRKTLVSVGYVVQPIALNARHFGVPQNRPRMMLIGLRSDVAESVNATVSEMIWSSDDAWTHLTTPRANEAQTLTLVPTVGSRIPGDKPSDQHSAFQAICDLSTKGYLYPSTSPRYRRTEFRYASFMRGVSGEGNQSRALNVTARNHSEKTRQRFALYHFLSSHDIDRSILSVPKAGADRRATRAEITRRLGEHAKALPRDQSFFTDSDKSLADVIMRLGTQKHSQRVVDPNTPSPTVLTLPDDLIHPYEPRIMTVREMARLQSFPDWFEFRSKETTGSNRRRYEVPQYSQVGNAVPPLMAQAVGERLLSVLRTYSDIVSSSV